MKFRIASSLQTSLLLYTQHLMYLLHFPLTALLGTIDLLIGPDPPIMPA